MVHLDKVEGQRGSMVLQDDGSILSSTGELASSEATAQAILSIMSHSLPVDFNSNNNATSRGASNQTQGGQNGITNNSATFDNASINAGPQSVEAGNGNSGSSVCKWNRLTVSFGDRSYVACLSNRKVHVVKRDSKKPGDEEGAGSE